MHVVPHGVDLLRFRPRPVPAPEPLRILAVGRLVAKKGFDVLLEAVVRLAVPFQLRIVGDGAEHRRLAANITSAGLDAQVVLVNSMTHDTLPAEYAAAHVVAVPSVVDRTGDRDGLPNVVLEAMASGRPVVASAIGAIPSAVTAGENGLLVSPGDSAALADALDTLARSPELRAQLGQHARERVERDFDLSSCSRRLVRVLESVYA